MKVGKKVTFHTVKKEGEDVVLYSLFVKVLALTS